MPPSEFHETMLRLLRREPFQPFDVELTDGRIVHVEIPEEIATNGGAAVWGSPTADSEIIFFDYRITRRLGTECAAPACGTLLLGRDSVLPVAPIAFRSGVITMTGDEFRETIFPGGHGVGGGVKM